MAISVSETNSDPSPETKPVISATSEMLTPSELAQPKQASNDADDYLQKVYPVLKILRV